jgi:hypothetical protein
VSSSYSVVLTQGGHTVRAEDAERILQAIEDGQKLVGVHVELYPGAVQVRPATLVTAHVMTVSPIEAPSDEASARAGSRSTMLRVVR